MKTLTTLFPVTLFVLGLLLVFASAGNDEITATTFILFAIGASMIYLAGRIFSKIYANDTEG